MAKITLEKAKLHLRVDGGEEDALISGWLLAAYLAIEGEIFRKVLEEAPTEAGSSDVVADEAINAAALLIIGHMYANRGDKSTDVPVAALWLIQPYVNYSGGA